MAKKVLTSRTFLRRITGQVSKLGVLHGVGVGSPSSHLRLLSGLQGMEVATSLSESGMHLNQDWVEQVRNYPQSNRPIAIHPFPLHSFPHLLGAKGRGNPWTMTMTIHCGSHLFA